MSQIQQVNGDTPSEMNIKQKTDGVEKAIVRYLHGLGDESEYLEAMETEINRVWDKQQIKKLREIRNRRYARRR